PRIACWSAACLRWPAYSNSMQFDPRSLTPSDKMNKLHHSTLAERRAAPSGTRNNLAVQLRNDPLVGKPVVCYEIRNMVHRQAHFLSVHRQRVAGSCLLHRGSCQIHPCLHARSSEL